MNDVIEKQKVAITELTIKIGGKVVKISTEEAKQLKGALDEIFPSRMDPINIHWHHDPFYVPNHPYNPNWTFEGTDFGTGGAVSGDSCNATLEILPTPPTIIT